MKKISAKENQNDAWWKFSKSAWLLIIGLVLFNIGCFASLSVLDRFFNEIFYLFDFRTWSWWYFVCLIIVVTFSIRWYLFYQKYIDDDFDWQSLDECKWFCILSGTITAILAIIVILHRYSLLGYFYYPVYYWLGFGGFSFFALQIFTVIFVIIGTLVFLIYKWITTLLNL
ncbi:MAG: hypothetical protein LBP59_13260 [Planctomycetaceae bacterium]|jgi:hypothetical protein|nr:hypothetical protein [Planctomycetaceae bacterium]